MSIKKFKIHREWSFVWEDIKWFINMYSGRVPNTYVLEVYTKTGDSPRKQQYSTTICSHYEPTVYRVLRNVSSSLPMVKDILNVLHKVTGVLVPPFLDDPDKMKDLLILSKEEFLASYPYMSEEEYDETLRIYRIIVDAQEWALKTKNTLVAIRDEASPGDAGNSISENQIKN